MGKLGIQEQKFCNAIELYVGGVHLAIGFKGGTTAQQSDPFQVLAVGWSLIGVTVIPEEVAELDIEQPRSCRCAFDKTAELDELPAFVVAHGGIGEPLKQVGALFHRIQ